jgi:cell wall-associated NlpC family hydrolase
MTLKKRQPMLHLFFCVCLGAASLGICGAAHSDDNPSSNTQPANGNGNTSSALEKWQSLTNRASELAIQAMGLIGIRYKYGGNTPENGLDCSGLVRLVFKEAWGANLPRTAEEISRVGQHVEAHDLQPGDLVFYNTLKRGFSHVGIYLGDNKFIHSPSTGGQVRIESMNLSYWKNRFSGARRIADPEQKSATGPTEVDALESLIKSREAAVSNPAQLNSRDRH